MERAEIKLIISALVPRAIGYDGKSGGAVRLNEILKRLVSDSGVQITAICTPSMQKYFEDAGISAEYLIIKSNLTFKNLIGLCLKSALVILKFIFSFTPKALESKEGKIAVYSSSDLFWEVIPAYFLKSKIKKIEWVQVIHHIYPDWKKRQGNLAVNFFGYYLQRFSLQLIRRHADKIIVLNNHVAENLADLDFQKEKIAFSLNGVECDYFEKIKPSEIQYDGIFLGRLSPSKGILDLLEIWKKICDTLPAAKLAVVGGGKSETKKLLAEKIKALGMEKNIDLLGYLENEMAYSILKSGKVFLCPSHEEGWGIAIAEAMACGLPVISWDLPAYREVFENYTFQIEENNILKFSAQVISLLKDEISRSRAGGKGKEFIRKYSWENVAKREFEIIAS